MKQTTILRGTAAALFFLIGQAAADTVTSSGRGCLISFDEPVVPESACRYSEHDKAEGDDKTDIFDITGDDANRPTAWWQDQNRLCVSFPKGSSCATEYRLSFRPGCGKYLSDKSMPQTSFTFHRPDSALSARLIPGMQEGAAIVFPCDENGKESLESRNFSPASAVTYSYRRIRGEESDKGRRTVLYGESIPATLAPAQLKHGLPDISLRLRTEQGVDWEKLTPESELPGAVLVQPERPLPPGTEWVLHGEAPQHGGFCSGNLLRREINRDLESRVSPLYANVNGRHALQVAVTFSAPLTEEEARRVFRDSVFSVGGNPAVNHEDGNCKTLKIGEKEYRFRLGTLIAPNGKEYPHVVSRETETDTCPRHYTEQGICRGFMTEVEGELPVLLDVTLPKGVTAALGRRSLSAQQHRLTLNPTWPSVGDAYGSYKGWSRYDNPLPVTLLPLKGEHKVRVPLDNAAELRVTAYRIPADMAARERQTLEKASVFSDSARRKVSIKRLLVRHHLGIEKFEPTDLQAFLTDLNHLLSHSSDPAAQNLIARLNGTPEREIPLPPTDNADCCLTEAVVDLDTLCGGSPAPGIYMLKLSARSLPSVRAALADLGLDEKTLDMDRYVLVQVSDLRASLSNSRLLLTRLSDGKAVEQAKVTPYRREEPFDSYAPCDRSFELKNGFLALPKIPWDNATDYALLAEDGDDYYLQANYRQPSEGEDVARALLHTDRNIYRPGEEVHVRGIFRLWDHEQSAATLPESGMPLSLRVSAPDGKTLVERTVTTDAAGSFSTSFSLPEGEEDVTGSYGIRADSADGRFRARHYVKSEVFRRDSFRIDSELEADKVAPQEFTLRLTARDFNGMPVSGGKVTLNFSSPLPLLRFGDKTYPAGEAGDERRHRGSYKLHLNAEGKAEIRGAFSAFLPTDGGRFTVSGSVANDREEYVQIQAKSMEVSPADFLISYDRDRLSVRDARDEKAPLSREQKLRVSLQYTAIETRTTSNGFTFITQKPGTSLMEKDITLSADCRESQPLGAEAVWRDFTEKNGEQAGREPCLVISGTDPAGRRTEKKVQLHLYTRPSEIITDTATAEGDHLTMNATFSREGTAFFLITHGSDTYMEQREVSGGRQLITLPLRNAEGALNLQALLMLPDAAGNYTVAEQHSAHVTVPLTSCTLHTRLQMPEKSLRPGAPLHLSGQVRNKDGRGTPAAVTLYAVDRGMLFGYEATDLVSFFTEPRHTLFFRDAFPYSLRETTPPRPSPVMLPGIWGDADGGISCASNRAHEAFACESAPCPTSVSRSMKKRLVAGGTSYMDESGDGEDCITMAPCVAMDYMPTDTDTSPTVPHLRANFSPVAFWLGSIRTDAEGNFSADIPALPDTLTTYSVFALVLGEDGSHFGNAEGSITVNQDLMLSPGAPLFMSTGDTLRLPLSVSYAGDGTGTWEVTLKGEAEAQKIHLDAGAGGTLYFDYTATAEGEASLEWTAAELNDDATGRAAGDAVQTKFPVRFPAPLLKEVHHTVLEAGQSQKAASLLAPELSDSVRGQMELQLSANPLLHLSGCMDFLLDYPYGCTEQTAGGLLPWLLYDRLAPVSPLMAQTPAAEVHQIIADSVKKILKRQQADGGLSYWAKGKSCGWVSAYAGMVLTIAEEQGVSVPNDRMQALRRYLENYLSELRKEKSHPNNVAPLTLFAIGRSLRDNDLMTQATELALTQESEQKKRLGWFLHRDTQADLQFIAALRRNPTEKHAAFLQWMRARGHDYRHTTTWRSGWMLIALQEYLRLTPPSATEATVQLQDGQSLTLGQGITTLHPQGKPLSAVPTELTCQAGTAYVTINVKAQPTQTEYPGITEKGLQITRLYEKKGEDGVWREAQDFAVGDMVRITLTCAKTADELEYFVLEDYLPSCMEAITPNIPSQAAGLEWLPWSTFFDNKEYLADRVRGFCTRWYGRELLNMSYYARVKRAGSTTAPPAQAQLMYEPQIYGLSPNKRVQSR